jgi:hypothetical protein
VEVIKTILLLPVFLFVAVGGLDILVIAVFIGVPAFFYYKLKERKRRKIYGPL